MSGSAIVQPHSGRLENLLVWAAAAILVVVAATSALTRGADTGTPPLAEWQVSAFDGLAADDQAIYSALSVSAEDIGWMQYDSGVWPDIPEIEEMLLPPFLKDAFWEEHGRVAWQLLASADFNHGGATAYTGRAGTNAGQSAYLLVYQHRHMGVSFSNQAQIWVHQQTEPEAPTGYTNENLVRAGWRQVVPYSGADEVARLKGSK